MDKKVFNNDDYCDVYNGKICDNCGDCLEMQGIDTKAIRIADIAKEVEENKKIEETLKKLAEEEQEEMEDDLEEELTTENKNYEPIIVEDCSILGKLVGIYRAY